MPNTVIRFSCPSPHEMADGASRHCPSPPGIFASYAPPYGNGAYAIDMNATAGYQRSPVSHRNFAGTPLKLSMATPATGGPYKLGPRFSFFSGATITCHYKYFLQGAWKITSS